MEKKLQSDFVKEQMNAPGLRLVAHAVTGGTAEDFYEEGSNYGPMQYAGEAPTRALISQV